MFEKSCEELWELFIYQYSYIKWHINPPVTSLCKNINTVNRKTHIAQKYLLLPVSVKSEPLYVLNTKEKTCNNT